MALVNELARNPSRDLEWAVCERFAESRSWISRNVLTQQPLDSIILIDRWYPSDAAFRHTISFAEILQLNRERDVRVPDVHVGVVTAPDISWARAAAVLGRNHMDVAAIVKASSDQTGRPNI